MKQHKLIAEGLHVGLRLDQFIGQSGLLSRSTAQKLIESGCVMCNGITASKKHLIAEGDIIIVNIPEPKIYDAVAEDIPLNIVYEDDYLIIVNKPKGMVVHPAAGHIDGTLVNALMHHCGSELSGIAGVIRPGIVHRIDKDTSGLLLVAKNDAAHLGLSSQLKDHTMSRTYYAVVYGHPDNESGQINLPLNRHPKERKKMAVVSHGGREAVTDYQIVEYLSGFAVVKLNLHTGRTHQIRVHMSYIGHPIVGDAVYGPKKVITETKGQCLHAATLGFIHPVSGEKLFFESELPDYFTRFVEKYRQEEI